MNDKEHFINTTNIDSDLQKMIDALPFYVMLIDAGHNIVMANKAVKTSLGVNPKEIIGGYCPKVIHGCDGIYPHCPLEEAVRTQMPAEYEFFNADNNTWIASSVYPSGHTSLDGKKIYLHVARDITQSKKAEEDLKISLQKLTKLTQSVIQAITLTVEKRDPYTAGHQQRVSKLSAAIAREMGFTPEQTEGMRVASLVHDIGKITIPIEILSKPGKISIHEMNIIKTHSQVGYEILEGIEFPWPVAQIIYQHHERINGSGYPQSLTGDSIITEAKILALADVVEAMSHHRPYRQALGIEKALIEITVNKGILYDPEVVDTCLKLFTRKGLVSIKSSSVLIS